MYIGVFYYGVNSLKNFQNSLEEFTSGMALRKQQLPLEAGDKDKKTSVEVYRYFGKSAS